MIALILAAALSSPAPCSFSTYSATPAPGTTLVAVVLPASLDPSGCTLQLEHGTRVFKISAMLISATQNESDAQGPYTVSVFSWISGYDLTVSSQGSSTVYTDACGNKYTFQGKVEIHDQRSKLAFFAPDETLPPQFCHAPDYTVP